MSKDATARAIAMAAAGVIVGLCGQARAGQFSSVELPTEIDTRNFPGLPQGEGRNFTFQDSYDGTNETNRSQSPLHSTDGNNSFHVSDTDGNFAVAWQYNFSDFDDPSNPNVPNGVSAFSDMFNSTKLLIDITVPAGQTAAWAGGYAGFNYAYGSSNYPTGLYVTSYNISDGGNQYQYTAAPASQTGAATQSYIWDFGGEFVNAGIPIWDGLTQYMILHWHHNSEPGKPHQYFMDNFRWVNENTATNPTWQGAGAGSWTDAARWANGVPNAVGARAIFYGAGSGAVTLNSAVTVGAIVLDSQRTSYNGIGPKSTITAVDDPDLAPIINYVVSGTGGITLDATAAGGTTEIVAIAGSHTFGVPITVNDNLRIDTAAGFGPDSNPSLPGGGRWSNAGAAGLTFAAPVTLAPGVSASVSGVGAVSFAGGISGGAGSAVNIRGGNTTFGASVSAGALNVSSNAKVTVTPGGTKVINVGALTVAGTIDLKDNKLVTTSSAGSATGGVYSGVQGLVQSAQNGGAWDGKGLGTSMPDALNNLTTIAVATGEQILGLGPTDTALWGGQVINGASTLAMYTYAGDLNLDGTINPDDYANISFNDPNPSASGYYNGDINYDGDINADDFATIDFNFNAQGAPFPVGSAATGLTAVPEPSGVACLFAGALFTSRTRKRRRRVK